MNRLANGLAIGFLVGLAVGHISGQRYGERQASLRIFKEAIGNYSAFKTVSNVTYVATYALLIWADGDVTAYHRNLPIDLPENPENTEKNKP